MLEAAFPQILLIWWSYLEKVIQMRFEIRVAIVHIFGMPWAFEGKAQISYGIIRNKLVWAKIRPKEGAKIELLREICQILSDLSDLQV